jgi:hypothetical protein
MSTRYVLLFVVFVCALSWAQTSPSSSERTRQLSDVRTVEISSEVADMFRPPLMCDAQGNLFLMTYSDSVEGIRKLDVRGKRLASFKAVNQPDVQVTLAGHFSISPEGEVTQLVYTSEIARYVFRFGSDGTLKSKVKLDPGFPWLPAQVVAFSDGSLLVAGQRMHSGRTPYTIFTGLFKSDGALIKEIRLEDDKLLMDLSSSGDKSVSSPTLPEHNQAVTMGSMELGRDGNAYLMRRLPNPIVYVISATGEVLRRFTVKASQKGMSAVSMHVAETQLAVLFRDADTNEQRLKVVDLEGREVITYEDKAPNRRSVLGPAFVCFSDNPVRFTFLSSTKDHLLGIKIAEGL